LFQPLCGGLDVHTSQGERRWNTSEVVPERLLQIDVFAGRQFEERGEPERVRPLLDIHLINGGGREKWRRQWILRGRWWRWWWWYGCWARHFRVGGGFVVDSGGETG
jgi:hypothetical protein